MAKEPAPTPTHDVHTDPTGRFRWTEEHGLYRHDGMWADVPRHVALPDSGGQPVRMPDQNGVPAPLPAVVLRCQCPDEVKADPEKLAARHGTLETGALRHCPGATVDVGESLLASTSFHTPAQGG